MLPAFCVAGRIAWPALLLTACAALPWDPATSVSELRVGAVVAEPPEVPPASTLELSVHLLDPGGPRDVLAWTCLSWSGTCLEAGPPDRPLGTFTRVFLDARPVELAAVAVPVEAERLLLDVDVVPVLQWTLACRPGVCPLIDAVAADPAPGTDAWREAVRDLAAPGRWLRDLPVEDVSLAVKTLALSDRPPSDRNLNPVLERLDGDAPLVAPPGGSLALRFSASQGTLHPQATLGGFVATAVPAAEVVVLTWVAPEAPGRGEVLVALEDGEGGTAVWRGAVEVR